MLDQLRNDIQTRLEELLSEAEKLRHALTALGSHDGNGPRASDGNSAPSRRRRRAGSATASATPTRKPGRPRRSTRSATAPPASKPAAVQANTARDGASAAPGRTAPGATKTAVLAALAKGRAMTAGEVANATGLGRASVSTTLSKLAKTGQVNKATRGYQIAGQTTIQSKVSASGSRKDGQPAS